MYILFWSQFVTKFKKRLDPTSPNSQDNVSSLYRKQIVGTHKILINNKLILHLYIFGYLFFLIFFLVFLLLLNEWKKRMQILMKSGEY